jgi:hypothetical protein
MQKSITLLLIATLTLGASIPALSATDDDSPLAEAMSSLNSSFRTFRKAVKGDAPNKELALTELLKMQAAVHSAKSETPESAKPKGQPANLSPEAARALTRDYRKALISCEKALLDLELLILDEKYSEVDVALRGVLAMKKAGHDKFIED